MSRSFTGLSGSYLESSTNLTVVATTSYTVSGWIYPIGWGGVSGGTVFGLSGLSDLALFIAKDIADNNGQLYGQINVAKIQMAAATSAAGTLVLNQWQYVTFVFNEATGKPQLFLNGVEVSYSVQNSHTGTASNSGPIFIGNDAISGSTGAFDGYIDSVAIWNTALTATQIKAAMKYAGSPGVLPSNLVAYWPLLGTTSPEPDVPTDTYPLAVHSATQGPNSPGQTPALVAYTTVIGTSIFNRTNIRTATLGSGTPN